MVKDLFLHILFSTSAAGILNGRENVESKKWLRLYTSHV